MLFRTTFHTLSTCSITHDISTIYTNTNSRNFAANTIIQPKITITQKLSSSLVESSPSNISIDIRTTHDYVTVTSYSNNSNDIFQSEVIFEKLKVTKLKSDLLDDLRVEIKDIIKKELESLHTNSTHSTTNYITEIKSLKRELDIKERMTTQLLNTVKEISTVNMLQCQIWNIILFQ